MGRAAPRPAARAAHARRHRQAGHRRLLPGLRRRRRAAWWASRRASQLAARPRTAAPRTASSAPSSSRSSPACADFVHRAEHDRATSSRSTRDAGQLAAAPASRSPPAAAASVPARPGRPGWRPRPRARPRRSRDRRRAWLEPTRARVTETVDDFDATRRTEVVQHALLAARRCARGRRGGRARSAGAGRRPSPRAARA